MDILTALTLLNQLIAQSQALARLIQEAQAQGRDISSEELDALAGNDDEARASLQAAIERAQSEGR